LFVVLRIDLDKETCHVKHAHDIHGALNETDQVTLSLRVYGKHINYTGRSMFDPDKKTETLFVVKIE
jgi:hypothetical protein